MIHVLLIAYLSLLIIRFIRESSTSSELLHSLRDNKLNWTKFGRVHRVSDLANRKSFCVFIFAQEGNALRTFRDCKKKRRMFERKEKWEQTDWKRLQSE